MIRTTRKEDAEDLLIISLIKDKTELEKTILKLKENNNILTSDLRKVSDEKISLRKEVDELRELIKGYNRFHTATEVPKMTSIKNPSPTSLPQDWQWPTSNKLESDIPLRFR